MELTYEEQQKFLSALSGAGGMLMWIAAKVVTDDTISKEELIALPAIVDEIKECVESLGGQEALREHIENEKKKQGGFGGIN